MTTPLLMRPVLVPGKPRPRPRPILLINGQLVRLPLSPWTLEFSAPSRCELFVDDFPIEAQKRGGFSHLTITVTHEDATHKTIFKGSFSSSIRWSERMVIHVTTDPDQNGVYNDVYVRNCWCDTLNRFSSRIL